MKQPIAGVRLTRFPELGFAKHGHDLWRIIDACSGAAIGPFYKSKAELLGDLERYAREYGCETSRPDPMDLIREAIDEWPEFDGDDQVAGGDLVEWFGNWRRRAIDLVG